MEHTDTTDMEIVRSTLWGKQPTDNPVKAFNRIVLEYYRLKAMVKDQEETIKILENIIERQENNCAKAEDIMKKMAWASAYQTYLTQAQEIETTTAAHKAYQEASKL